MTLTAMGLPHEGKELQLLLYNSFPAHGLRIISTKKILDELHRRALVRDCLFQDTHAARSCAHPATHSLPACFVALAGTHRERDAPLRIREETGTH